MQKTFPVFRAMAAASILVFSAACQNSIALQREGEIFSSIPYDETPCDALRSQRNALAAQHGVSPQAERESLQESDIAGFGIFVPDMRGSSERARARAVGEITAMNRSLTRRACSQA